MSDEPEYREEYRDDASEADASSSNGWIIVMFLAAFAIAIATLVYFGDHDWSHPRPQATIIPDDVKPVAVPRAAPPVFEPTPAPTETPAEQEGQAVTPTGDNATPAHHSGDDPAKFQQSAPDSSAAVETAPEPTVGPGGTFAADTTMPASHDDATAAAPDAPADDSLSGSPTLPTALPTVSDAPPHRRHRHHWPRHGHRPMTCIGNVDASRFLCDAATLGGAIP